MKRLIIALLCFVSLTSCYNDAGFILVRRDIIDVGDVAVGDSVHATFKFKNNNTDTVRLSFMPECDCTTVNTDVLILSSGKTGELKVSVAVETEGEFYKYIFVQAIGGDGFLTVSVKGHSN